MSGPIQLIPPGMMGLLQLKQSGKLPSVLLDQVAPVLELRDWYMQARMQNETSLFSLVTNLHTASIATGAQGYTQFTLPVAATVPQGQTWYVQDFSCICFNIASGDVCSYAPAILEPNQLVACAVGPQVPDLGTARTRQLVAKADHAFWLTPGSQLGVLVSDVLSAGGVQIRTTFRATAMPL